MRQVFKMGTPRGLQGTARAFFATILGLLMLLCDWMKRWSAVTALSQPTDDRVRIPRAQAA